MFNTPNDMQWRSQLDGLHYKDTKTYIAQIIDAEGDGNYNDALSQEWSVKLVGWDTELYKCRAMVPLGGYNGQGEYRNYKKGDVVIVVAREGQMEEMMIMGSVRLNGEQQKLEEDGQALKYGEMVTGASGQLTPANQVSMHPTRVTKMDGETKIHGSNNLTEIFTDPALGETLESRQAAQPLPGVVESVNKEGVYSIYAHGGIVQYPDGNLVFVSNGSKENKCTKFLKQAQRHAAIAAQLEALSILSIQNIDTVLDAIDGGEYSFSELPGLETGVIGDANVFGDGEFSISSATPILSPLTARPVEIETPENEDNVPVERAQGRPLADADLEIPGEQRQENAKEGLETRNPLYRAKKHKELAKLAQQIAEDCNRNSSAYHQQANLMANTVGNHFGNGGAVPTANIPDIQPSQFFGNTNASNYSSRNAGVPKPPIISEPADPTENYDSQQTLGEHLPIKRIFLHNTNAPLQQTINTFKDPKSEVSAHYTVARDGKVYQHVPDNRRAYHSGKLGNGNSIGIEFVATSVVEGLPIDQRLTPPQKESGIQLIKYLVDVYEVDKSKIAGHRTVYDTKCPGLIWPTEQNLRDWVNANI